MPEKIPELILIRPRERLVSSPDRQKNNGGLCYLIEIISAVSLVVIVLPVTDFFRHISLRKLCCVLLKGRKRTKRRLNIFSSRAESEGLLKAQPPPH
jgi:hypothetical protein